MHFKVSTKKKKNGNVEHLQENDKDGNVEYFECLCFAYIMIVMHLHMWCKEMSIILCICS